MTTEGPIQAPYARHVFICTGPYCDPDGDAPALYRKLAHTLGHHGQYDNPTRVKRGTTPCLGVCYSGPLLVVYPDGIWYHSVDEAKLDRIVEEHLKANRPVEEFIFHRLDQNPEIHLHLNGAYTDDPQAERATHLVNQKTTLDPVRARAQPTVRRT